MHDIFTEINELKAKHNAVILSHYYQDPDIQDISDYMGDSLALARKAQKTNADVILFCGVHFMAETAKILNPTKKVIVPDINAGCSLADSAPKEEFEKWIKQHPDHIVISYINCTAEVKALSDYICTSSNAEQIINHIPANKKIIFAPDKFLGNYLIKKTNRDLLLWNGSCQVHEIFSEKELVKLKVRHPNAGIIAHPECDENILNHANHIGSTTSLINYTKISKSNQFIIITEPGVIHQMKKNNPEKEYIPLPSNDGCACNECPHMRLNTLEKMKQALMSLEPEIIMNEKLRLSALKPLTKMLELSK